MAAQTVIKLRRDTAANWTSANPTLASGEQGLETDTGKIKIGNGSTAWASLSYSNPGGAIPQSQVTNLTSDLGSKASSSSPTFTGTITTSLTTAGYVKTNSSGVLSSSTQIAQSDVTGLTSSLAAKASLTGVETLSNKTLDAPSIIAYTWTTVGNFVDFMFSGMTGIPSVTITATSPVQIMQPFSLVRFSPFGNPLQESSFTVQGWMENFDPGYGVYTYTINALLVDSPAQTFLDSSLGVPYGNITISSLSSVTISSTELMYLDGVTSNIQTQINVIAANSGGLDPFLLMGA